MVCNYSPPGGDGTPCRHEFCYRCLGEWAPHRLRPGYACDPALLETKERQEREKAERERWVLPSCLVMVVSFCYIKFVFAVCRCCVLCAGVRARARVCVWPTHFIRSTVESVCVCE